MLLGLAALTASNALPETFALHDIAAWYVRPGKGPELRVQSIVEHRGRFSALVRTAILSTEGDLVLEAVSHHFIIDESGPA